MGDPMKDAVLTRELLEKTFRQIEAAPIPLSYTYFITESQLADVRLLHETDPEALRKIIEENPDVAAMLQGLF